MALINVENKKQILVIIFAIAAGIVASAMIGNYVTTRINDKTTELAHQYEMVQAQKQKEYNDQLMAMNQKIAEVEERARKAAEEAAKVAEARAAAQASAETKVKKPKASLALRTPAGKRALTVKIDSLGAVGGLVNPGDYVDVIANLNVPSKLSKEKPEMITAMIFQKLQILAVNTNMDEPGQYDEQQKESGLRITFAVDPQEAGLLSFADKSGKLELALRSPAENKQQMLTAATWSTLAEYVLENQGADIQTVGSARVAVQEAVTPAKVETVEEARPYIQIYRGGREL